MIILPTGIHDAIALEEVNGVFWLAELELPGGTQYFAESGQFEWNGQTWLPFLDPEDPVGNIKQNLRIDEKLETKITLVNVTHGISDLLKTNDPQGCECNIYLYFESEADAIKVFKGTLGKAEKVEDYKISIPVTGYLQGPLTKLPSRVFATTCGFKFADGFDCPYNPTSGEGIVDPGTGLPFTYCPKTGVGCLARGMRGTPNSTHDWFGGFEKWQASSSGHLNNSGYFGIGRHHYTSQAECYDNFLGKAVPLVYGEIRFPAIPYFSLDESEFFLCGGFIGEGQIQQFIEVKVNGQTTHDFKYPPYNCHGYPGQQVPDLATGYTAGTADPFCGTAFSVIRINDEVGIQTGKQVDIDVHVKGRMVRSYYWSGQQLLYTTAYSNDPIDVLIDLYAAQRGGLGLGYGILNLNDIINERSYSWQTITDVDGVSRRRYTFNGVIADHDPAGDLLERIREEFSMYIRDYGDYIDFGFIRPDQTSVMTFTSSGTTPNIIINEDGTSTMQIWEKPVEDIPNRVYFSFLDASNNWEKTTFHLDSQQMIERAGKVVDESKFLCFTTNIGQALRIASNWMERNISGNWFASWTSPLRALEPEVGDVVTLVSTLLPTGTDTFLITSKEITKDLTVKYEAQLYRAAFYDDTVEDEYEDLLRGSPDNPLRMPTEVTGLSAVEEIVTVEGVNTSQIRVTYTRPPNDNIWKEVEIAWKDALAPDDGWISAVTSSEEEAVFTLPIVGYRMLEIRARSISRYGLRREWDNEAIPEFDLLVDGTPDNDVPDAPVNLTVTTQEDDTTIPSGMYRVKFDAGATNWDGVHTLFIECNGTLPFSDGTVKYSNLNEVGGTGVIDAGGTAIFKENAGWTPDDPGLIGCLVAIEDSHGHIHARLFAGNTADTVYTNGPIYLPDGSYTFHVITDFTKENLRWWMFEAARGDFSPINRTYTFDLPITNSSLYFRVCAYNAFGKSAWVTSDKIDNFPLDRTQAPPVTDFDITVNGFIGPDGTQKCECILDWTNPNPLLNFSHVRIHASEPLYGDLPGGYGGEGNYAGEGNHAFFIGEYWAPEQVFITNATNQEVTFYAVSVNEQGYYNPDWFTDGDYATVAVTLSPLDTAPDTVLGLQAECNSNDGWITVTWIANAERDVAGYQLQWRTAATEIGVQSAAWGAFGGPDDVMELLGTGYIHQINTSETGHWFQFRVRAVDNLSQTENWNTAAASSVVQAYATASLAVPSLPTNLQVGLTHRSQAGVSLTDIVVEWDNPIDAVYGGSEVWVMNSPDGVNWYLSQLKARVDEPDSDTLFTQISHEGTIKIALVPYNQSDIVADYANFVASDPIDLTPTGLASALAPSVTAVDAVEEVMLTVEVPPVTNNGGFYAGIELSCAATLNGTKYVIKEIATSNLLSDAVAEDVKTAISWAEFVASGIPTPSKNQNYYFFARMRTLANDYSLYSSDLDPSAQFRSGDVSNDDVAYFDASDVVMIIAASNLHVTIAWNSPTHNGDSVYQVNIQIATSNNFSNILSNLYIDNDQGSTNWVPATNGTYYVRIRYKNHSPEQWSSWYGLKGNTTYATVTTTPGVQQDSSYIDGATYLVLTYVDLPNADGVQIGARLGVGTPNALTCYNISIIWADSDSKLDDANNLVASNLKVTWTFQNSWFHLTQGTVSTTWIGKLLQIQDGSQWISAIIMQIDPAGNQVQVNVQPNTTQQTPQTARVCNPWWNRTGVHGYEVNQQLQGGELITVNQTYYTPGIVDFDPAVTTTMYVRAWASNIKGPGTQKTGSHTLPTVATKTNSLTLNYQENTASNGTFASLGGVFVDTNISTINYKMTFAFTQGTIKADSFIVWVKEGTTAPTDGELTSLPRYVFAAEQVSGAKTYYVEIPNLKQFQAYSFQVRSAKNGESCLNFGSNKGSVTNVIYTAGTDLTVYLEGTANFLTRSGNPTMIRAAGIYGYVTGAGSVLDMQPAQISIIPLNSLDKRLRISVGGSANSDPILIGNPGSGDIQFFTGSSSYKCRFACNVALNFGKELHFLSSGGLFGLMIYACDTCGYIVAPTNKDIVLQTLGTGKVSVTGPMTVSGTLTASGGISVSGALSGITSITMNGALSGVTTLAMTGALSGVTTITCSGLITSTAGGLTIAGAITGATTIAASSNITATGYVQADGGFKTKVVGVTYTGINAILTDLDGGTATFKNGLLVAYSAPPPGGP